METTWAGVPTGNTYDKYATTNPVARRLMAGFLRALDACLPATEPASVLEVGAGEGEIVRVMRDRYPSTPIVGVDLPDAELARAWHERQVVGAGADIAQLPFPSGAFDLVLAIEVLEHVPDPAGALDELARVGRRDLVLSVPREPLWRLANLARGKYVASLGNTPGHIQHWSRTAFCRLVASRFEVTAVHSPLPWTMLRARHATG